MKKPQLVYIHGGEVFDSPWAGFCSTVRENGRRLFKSSTLRWPDTLQAQLPEYQVVKLRMPAKYNAKYGAWERCFEDFLLHMENNVVLLGWSLGANFLVQYLSQHELPIKVRALHLVAGCYGAPGGFDLPEDLSGVIRQCEDIALYHSVDDFVVPFTDFQRYQAALPQARGHQFTDRNHFLQPEFRELVEHLKCCI